MIEGIDDRGICDGKEYLGKMGSQSISSPAAGQMFPIQDPTRYPTRILRLCVLRRLSQQEHSGYLHINGYWEIRGSFTEKRLKSSHRRMGVLLQSRTTETDTLSSAVVALISRKEEQESAVQVVVLSNTTKVDVDLS